MVVEFFQSRLSQDRINKVIQVSKDLEINPNWLLAVMYFETARTFSPSKRNSIGSVGLIQFTRDKAGVNYKTINGVKFLLDDIARMSFIEQMDLVYQYYKPYKGKIKSFIDTYLVTFFPVALGKSGSYVLQTSRLSASLIAKQNPIFDRNKDGKITKDEIVSFFKGYYERFGLEFNLINKVKNCPTCGAVLGGIAVFFYTVITIYL